MPRLSQLRDYGVPVGAQVLGGLLRRRSIGGAVNTLQSGVTRGMDELRRGTREASRTIGETYGTAREDLRPFREAGAGSLDMLRAGLEPGGELAQPYQRPTQYTPRSYEEMAQDPAFRFRVNEGRALIEAGANAGGTRFSAATLKALNDFAQESASQEFARIEQRDRDIFGQNYARDEEQFRRNQEDRYSRLFETAQMGQRAAEADAEAATRYGTTLAALQQSLSGQLADLELEAANAQATGDIERGNAISDTISGVLQSVQQVGIAKTLGGLLKAGGLSAAAGVGTSAALGGTAAAVTLPGSAAVVPALSTFGSSLLGGVAAPAAVAPAVLAPGAAAGAGASQGALMATLTNPITIAAGAAIGIGLLVRKAQAHHKADTWVQQFQNPFDQRMAQIDQLAASGSMSAADAQQLKAVSVREYLAAMQTFAQKGSDHQRVANQARNTFYQRYGDPSQYGAA